MKTIKFAIFALLFGCSIYSLNAQVKVHPNGVVNMGNPASPALTVNPNETVGIDNTNTILFNANTNFELNAPITTIKYAPESEYGFQFIPSTDIIASSNFGDYLAGQVPTLGMHYIQPVMALTGLYDSKASIGTFHNKLHMVHSLYYFSGGDYLGVLSSSDSNLKTNIRDIMPVSEKIFKLRPVVYDFIDSDSVKNSPKKNKGKGNNNGDYNGYSNNDNNSNRKNKVGFLAQEVLPLFPDLVVVGGDSSLRLDYAGLIPYLTKALQEQSEIVQEQVSAIQKQNEIIDGQNKTILNQNERIERLEQQIIDIQNGAYVADFTIADEESEENGSNTPKKSKSPQTNGTDNALYQNTPNPFNISTTIKYQLSDNATNAKICIYNLTGKQLQCYNLQATKGENKIEVRASSLQAGMYLYSLIVDDKLIDTKRMVLTE